MKAEKPKRQLDTSLITFPSDRITIGQMRRVQPHSFSSHDILYDYDIASIDGLAVVLIELRYAEMEFNRIANGVRGKITPNVLGLTDCRNLLDEAYREYGLSNDREASLALIEGIRTQVEAQARKGRSR
jgi:hypothetical protein